MLERLKWSVLALAQPAELQEGLFPKFVAVADELALAWEAAIETLPHDAPSLTPQQMTAVNALDGLILAMSGPNNLELWENDALRERGEWEKVRQFARDVAVAFGWPMQSPGSSTDIYVEVSDHDDAKSSK